MAVSVFLNCGQAIGLVVFDGVTSGFERIAVGETFAYEFVGFVAAVAVRMRLGVATVGMFGGCQSRCLVVLGYGKDLPGQGRLVFVH